MARRGFTLIELLLVISLIAVILGMGLGVFARLDLAQHAAAAQVQNVIRSAHNWSISRQAPARVRIDAKRNTIRALGFQVVGTWRFESLPIAGAFGLDGGCFGGEIVEGGYHGKALSFAGATPRSRAEIPVQSDPSWNLREGFSLRVALRPVDSAASQGSAASGGGAALQIGDSVGLESSEEGAVKAWIAAELADESGVRKGGRIPLEAPPGTLRPGRWTQIEVQYDRRKLRLLADEVLVAEVLEDAPVWKVESPLVLSPGNTAWPGAFDDLVVSAVGGDEETTLPKSVVFAAGAPQEILFAAGGALDRDRHREPVRMTLEFEDGRKMEIRVNLYGTVE